MERKLLELEKDKERKMKEERAIRKAKRRIKRKAIKGDCIIVK
jgi:hypothetical protein